MPSTDWSCNNYKNNVLITVEDVNGVSTSCGSVKDINEYKETTCPVKEMYKLTIALDLANLN